MFGIKKKEKKVVEQKYLICPHCEKRIYDPGDDENKSNEYGKIWDEIANKTQEKVGLFKPGDIIEMTTDFKTSSTRYPSKKLTESAQLARYQFVAQNQYQG